MKLLIGLGNPGEQYKGSRHNLGFEVVDEILRHLGGSWSLEKKLKSEVAKVGELILVKPQTYMNNSGMATQLVADYYKVLPEDIIIIHDDLDLLLGKLKVRVGGAAGGHHGVESVIEAIGDEFIRVRLGIGNDRSHSGEHNRVSFNAEHFVLETFLPKEKSKVKSMLKQAREAIETVLEKGIDVAQNQYN